MPAELAHGDHRRLASRHAAMDADELGLDPLGKRLDQRLGKTRIGGARLPRRERARDHPDADEEGLLAADDAGAVERLLIVAAPRRAPRRPAPSAWRASAPRRRSPGSSTASSSRGLPADDAGEPRRRPHDVGDQPEQAWIGGKQREELHAGRHLGDDLVEGGEREIGLGGAAERIEQGGKKLGQPLARARAPRRGIAAGLPGADGGDRRCRIAEAEALRGSASAAGSSSSAETTMRRRRARQLGQLLEQGPVMGFDPLELGRAARRRRQSVSAKPESFATRSSSSRSAGMIWVCWSPTICSRFSMRRRKR